MNLIEKLVVGSVVVGLVSCWLLALLPALMPYVVALFVMALAARVVWFYTQRW